MFSPEEQQLEICLLKSNLEQIENDLVVQLSSLPSFDAENEVKYRETIATLKIVRSSNAEMEKLKEENVRLTAQRMQLKLQCDDISKGLENAQSAHDHLTAAIKQEEKEIELKIRQYEDCLHEKADQFRKTRGFYNADEVKTETNKVNNLIVELEGELEKKRIFVNELKQKADSIHPEIPEDLPEIIGKLELEEKVKELSETLQKLEEKKKEYFL